VAFFVWVYYLPLHVDATIPEMSYFALSVIPLGDKPKNIYAQNFGAPSVLCFGSQSPA